VISQISILSTDLPVAGDYIIRNKDTLPSYDEGQNGANVYWNFSNALNHTSVTTAILDPVNTPYYSNFSTSNLAMTNDFASFIYLTKYNDSLVTNGIAGDLLGTGEVIKSYFVPNLKTDEFPTSFGNNFSDSYSFEATADGAVINAFLDSVRLKHYGTVYDTVDAWGGISTPMGFYAAIRVKSIEYSIDSIWTLPIFPPTWTIFQTAIDTVTTYSWLTKEGKLPIAEMTFDSLGNANVFIWSTMPGANLFENNKSKIKLYPNPVSDVLTVSISNQFVISASSLIVRDVLGKQITKINLSSKNSEIIEIDTKKFKCGVYVLSLLSNNGSIMYRAKFLKN